MFLAWPAQAQVRESLERVPGTDGEIYVLRAGREGAPGLLLIHGLGDAGARDFAPLLPELSKRYDVLAFDLPGLARSKSGKGPYSPRHYAALASAVIARYFKGPVAVLGHSMGGAISLQLAADHPEQVSKLALLDVAGVLHYRTYLRELIAGSRADQSWWERTKAGARGALFDIGLFPMRHVKLEDLALEANASWRALFSSNVAAALLFMQHDFGPAIRRITSPTFIGWGVHDTIAPLRTATILRSSLPVRRWRLFSSSEHVPMRTDPKAVNEALIEFLDATLVPFVETPIASTREGRCERVRNRIFEGDYDRIIIHRCDDIVLRHVRARSVQIDRSRVEMEDVVLDAPAIALAVHRSTVRWTGGSMRGDVCLEADHSQLDFAGVRCRYRGEATRVHEESALVASASALADDTREIALHGEYRLFRTEEGDMTELVPREKGRFADHSRTALAGDELSGNWLEGEDFRGAQMRGMDLSGSQLSHVVFEGADLRGANLSSSRMIEARLRGADLRGANMNETNLQGADLRGADLRDASLRNARLQGARYDAKTKFSKEFTPRGMREEPVEAVEVVAP